MKRQVVQDFLNLPGIAGVALMDGRVRPCFLGIDRGLNFQQKEALTQGIHQVVETTPPNLQAFSFRFAEQTIEIYKLNRGIILLVMTGETLVRSHYRQALAELQAAIEEDPQNVVATFRMEVGSTTLQDQDYWKKADPPIVTAMPSPSPRSAPPPPPPASPALEPPAPKSAPSSVSRPGSGDAYTEADAIAALNTLSEITSHYLGRTVVSNTWSATRPLLPWLSSLQIDREGGFQPSHPSKTIFLTPEQIDGLRRWVQAFQKKGSRIIRDFPNIVRQRLEPRLVELLYPPGGDDSG